MRRFRTLSAHRALFSRARFSLESKGKQELASLDRDLESWRRKLESTRSADWNSPLLLKTKAQRKKKVIENKLDLCFGKLGHALTTAAKHRKTIDDFRFGKSILCPIFVFSFVSSARPGVVLTPLHCGLRANHHETKKFTPTLFCNGNARNMYRCLC